jgi:DNA recombination protein RmuC
LAVEIIIGAAVISAAIVFVGWLYISRPPHGGLAPESIAALQRELHGVMQTVNAQIGGLTSTVSQQMTATNDQMFRHLTTQFGESQKLVTGVRDAVNSQITELAKRVGETQEAAKQVFGLAEQLKNLEKVLTSQRQRGSLGEAGLALVLGNTLPPTAYKLQYAFANGDRVDAAIMIPDGQIIPIDAKFSLDNYMTAVNEPDDARRAEYEDRFKGDLKARIDETCKYIRADEGTVDFAFMFIPSEAIFYDLLVNEVGTVRANTRNLVEYAGDKKVIIVSPTTFAAYLQTVLMGFRAFRIENAARDIAKNVDTLGRHLNAYLEFFHKVGVSLGHAVGHYNAAGKELGKIDKDVVKITGSSPALGVEAVERPQPAAN